MLDCPHLSANAETLRGFSPAWIGIDFRTAAFCSAHGKPPQHRTLPQGTTVLGVAAGLWLRSGLGIRVGHFRPPENGPMVDVGYTTLDGL